MTILNRLAQLIRDVKEVGLLNDKDDVWVNWKKSVATLYYPERMLTEECIFSVEIKFESNDTDGVETLFYPHIVNVFKEEFSEFIVEACFAEEHENGNDICGMLVTVKIKQLID